MIYTRSAFCYKNPKPSLAHCISIPAYVRDLL